MRQPNDLSSNNRRLMVIMALLAAILLICYLVPLLWDFSGTPLAHSSSPDHSNTIYVIDGGGFNFIPSQLGIGQHIFIWQRWKLFPKKVGYINNYGDLGTYPQCTIKWSRGKAEVNVISDDAGTESLSFYIMHNQVVKTQRSYSTQKCLTQ